MLEGEQEVGVHLLLVLAGLRRFPMFNASVDPFREEIVFKKFYNLGVAVDSGKGLVVPVVIGTSIVCLTALGAVSARAGGAPAWP